MRSRKRRASLEKQSLKNIQNLESQLSSKSYQSKEWVKKLFYQVWKPRLKQPKRSTPMTKVTSQAVSIITRIIIGILFLMLLDSRSFQILFIWMNFNISCSRRQSLLDGLSTCIMEIKTPAELWPKEELKVCYLQFFLIENKPKLKGVLLIQTW